jgi:hypothetical protein
MVIVNWESGANFGPDSFLRPRIMKRNGLVFALGTALVLSACDTSSPTDSEVTVDGAAFEELAVAALQANENRGVPLPSLDRLLRETLQAVRAEPSAHAEGIAFLKRAHAQAKKAREALEAGDKEAARVHNARRGALTLEAIISVLGAGVVDQALAGVDQGLARIEKALAGRTLPDRYRKGLDWAHALSARGHVALDAGQYRHALGAALSAADVLRALSVPYQAQKAIHRATRALSAAYEAVKADPTQAETNALRRARRFLRAAKEAFDAKNFQKAFRLATESGKLSLEVLRARSGG